MQASNAYISRLYVQRKQSIASNHFRLSDPAEKQSKSPPDSLTFFRITIHRCNRNSRSYVNFYTRSSCFRFANVFPLAIFHHVAFFMGRRFECESTQWAWRAVSRPIGSSRNIMSCLFNRNTLATIDGYRTWCWLFFEWLTQVRLDKRGFHCVEIERIVLVAKLQL